MIRKRYGTDRRKVLKGDQMEMRIVFIAEPFEWGYFHFFLSDALCEECIRLSRAKLEGSLPEKKCLTKKYENNTESLRKPYGRFSPNLIASHKTERAMRKQKKSHKQRILTSIQN